MKSIISTVLLTVLTSSAAYGEGLQVETRAFHANMRLDADKATYLQDGAPATTDGVSSSYYNTAGLGLAAVHVVDDILELGLGFSFARYYPSNGVQMDQTVLNGFSRINLAKTETSKVYMLGGLSRQQLTQDNESNEFARYKSSFTPIVNVDLGIGGTINFGSADLGLEYKHSNTVAAGRASFQSLYKIQGLTGNQVSSDKIKFRNVALEGQELALTFGVKM
ncbi:MAG TPA: hypothetical protein VE954_33835 [Oligoflexus sp.]|uniref:hypothetical protein n=1 Tax=Oligoflexus sp. TaxID=1971216 RepID=UPI002D46EE49|nr:hypothetical protein [Oligoflexus sp.]HYX38108.1 hypothetical protein [Oligoflexus sp.]